MPVWLSRRSSSRSLSHTTAAVSARMVREQGSAGRVGQCNHKGHTLPHLLTVARPLACYSMSTSKRQFNPSRGGTHRRV